MATSVFVLWSGGVDSTYLVIRLLDQGYQVDTGYVEIESNIKKTQMEQAAIARMTLQIGKKFSQFHHHGTIFAARNATTGRRLKYKQLPYFLHALMVAPSSTFRALGYVRGDSAIKNLEKIRDVYNGYQNICWEPLPPLIFPLKNTSKEQIGDHMTRIHPEIFENCVWCEKPAGDDFAPCGLCTPCVRWNAEGPTEIIK